MRKAFTLIELLIVVAIIAILAAIAVPNFLEAQTRSKVSRVKADIRTIKTGIESYRVDNNRYPIGTDRLDKWGHQITSPIAYLTSVPSPDPFLSAESPSGEPWTAGLRTYGYMTLKDKNVQSGLTTRTPPDTYTLWSFGPDRQPSGINWVPWGVWLNNADPAFSLARADGATGARTYDPTNGTISDGDIAGFGGDIMGLPSMVPQ